MQDVERSSTEKNLKFFQEKQPLESDVDL